MSSIFSALPSALPRIPLKSPFSLVPDKVHSNVIAKALNIILATPLEEGDLDFLEHRSVSVHVTDLDMKFALSLNQEKLTASPWKAGDQLNIAGKTHDFLQLATRTEDADTLFFQRRLKMNGDTELGLEVKNLLDGLDLETVRFHQPIDKALKTLLSLSERFR